MVKSNALTEVAKGMDGAGSTAATWSKRRGIGRVVDQFDKLRLTRECATILLYLLTDMVFNYAEEKDLLALPRAFEI